MPGVRHHAEPEETEVEIVAVGKDRRGRVVLRRFEGGPSAKRSSAVRVEDVPDRPDGEDWSGPLPKRVRAEVVRLRIAWHLELTSMGLTVRDVANHTSWSETIVRRDVKKALAAAGRYDLDEVRKVRALSRSRLEMSLRRLNRLFIEAKNEPDADPLHLAALVDKMNATTVAIGRLYGVEKIVIDISSKSDVAVFGRSAPILEEGAGMLEGGGLDGGIVLPAEIVEEEPAKLASGE